MNLLIPAKADALLGLVWGGDETKIARRGDAQVSLKEVALLFVTSQTGDISSS